MIAIGSSTARANTSEIYPESFRYNRARRAPGLSGGRGRRDDGGFDGRAGVVGAGQARDQGHQRE